jgi:subtilisin family serine protease
MRKLIILLVSVTTVAGGIPLRASGAAGDDPVAPVSHYILRASPDEVDAIAARHGLAIERRDETEGIYTVAGSQDPVALKAEIDADGSVASFEQDLGVVLPEQPLLPSDPVLSADPSLGPSHLSRPPALVPPPVAGGMPDTTPTTYYGNNVWLGYTLQAGTAIIRMTEAHDNYATGAGTIAIIDSGIDVTHPVLAGSIVDGFDFIAEGTAITPDSGSLQQSTASILEFSGGDQSVDPFTFAQVNQSTAAILEQSTAAILESDPLPNGFGHGTMVAGLVHLVAPTAKIMPLRVFRADGTGSVYDVVRAVYFAVDHGATVINMSFSLSQWSEELLRAVNYAAKNKVVCVAAAGNSGKETLVFPAGFRQVLGVGSTDYLDQRSLFSNFGTSLVRLSAPGEQLVTAFPGSHYALVSGTSFSAPLVSGAAALLLQLDPTMSPAEVDAVLSRSNSSRYGAATGSTRLDVYIALGRVKPPDDDRN